MDWLVALTRGGVGRFRSQIGTNLIELGLRVTTMSLPNPPSSPGDASKVLEQLAAMAVINLPPRPAMDWRNAAEFTHLEWRFNIFTRIMNGAPQAEKMIQHLAKARYVAAVPLLVRLWNESPVSLVWMAAGRALLAMPSREAQVALRAAIDWPQHEAIRLAISSWENESAAQLYDALLPWIDPSAATDDPAWLAQQRRVLQECLIRAVRWRKEDARWVRLALRVRDDRHIGPTATWQFLSKLQHVEIEETLRQWPDPLPPPQRSITGPRDYLARYRRGEHGEVWRELRELGPLQEADLRAEATAVAVATMERVQRNVQAVEARLIAAGYVFSTLPEVPPRLADEVLAEVAMVTGGPVPISLAAFWRVVGPVNWMQEMEEDKAPPIRGLCLAGADPLVVAPPAWTDGVLRDWIRRRQRLHPAAVGRFCIPVAPDHHHKAKVSGGSPYEIATPDEAIDAYLRGEKHDLHFVDYLRLCFARGGFSLLGEDTRIPPEGEEFWALLRSDREPF